jgi:hypothetical protein
MKPAAWYVKPAARVDFYTASAAAARRGEIFIGYKKITGAGFEIVVNPDKTESTVFAEEDSFIVIAEE